MMRWTGALLSAALVCGQATGQVTDRSSNETLTATVNRASLFEGESVKLVVTMNGDPGTAQPDFSALNRDFLVSEMSTNSQFGLNNGRREMTVSWSVNLEPRGSGELTIPVIRIGRHQTSPITISVLPRGQGGDVDDDIFLEMEAGPDNPYVHSQVLLTLRLYHVEALTEGRIFEPAIANAVVERLGEDVAYTATLGNVRYKVLERRFAVFPERSGEMPIPAAGFRGRVADSRTGFNSIFDRGRRVSVTSRPITLQVRPVPPEATHNAWLPAANIELTETWPEGGAHFVVGEPATRTLILKAKGLLSPQVPELSLPESVDFKIYPDQSQTQLRTDGKWVYAEREQSYAIVPTKAGDLTLPEIRIPWWNTETDQPEYATVAAAEIQVAPGATIAPPPVAVAALTADAPPVDANGWRALAIGLAVVWLLTLLAWLRDRAPLKPKRRREKDPSLAQARARLRKACQTSDPAAAASALLDLANRAPAFGRQRSLQSLSRTLRDPSWTRVLGELERVLYAPGQSIWNGNELWNLAKSGLRAPKAPTASSARPLPPLYSR